MLYWRDLAAIDVIVDEPYAVGEWYSGIQIYLQLVTPPRAPGWTSALQRQLGIY